MNVVLHDLLRNRQEILTHFTEPDNLVDITWSHDGQWILFVSTHDFIHSRGNERNVFRVRFDGTGLEMLTGEYVDPEEVPAPYAVVRGRVVDGEGECLVCAQGTQVAAVDDDGSFQLSGVPLSATWIRVVCRDGQGILQGGTGLEAREGKFAPLTIPVEPTGQGWRQVSLSRDGNTLAGVLYQWTLGDEGKREYTYQGVLYDLEQGEQKLLACPEEKTLMGVAWSPVADQLVCALAGEEGTSLWLWDAEGDALEPLIEIPNPEAEILVATDPAWSPDGRRVAFALRHRHWWEDPKYRTDLMLVSADGEELTTLVESEWGNVAKHPSWSADGEAVFYQFSPGEPAVPYGERKGGDIWSIGVLDATPVPLTEDGTSYLPALPSRLSP
jgi:Tol biopolymer transport system component